MSPRCLALRVALHRAHSKALYIPVAVSIALLTQQHPFPLAPHEVSTNGYHLLPAPQHPDMVGIFSPITDILYEFFSFSNISLLPLFFLRKEGHVILLCLTNDLLARSQLLSISIQNGGQGWLKFSPQKDLYLMGSNPISTIIFLTKSTHNSDNHGAMFS